MDILRKCRGDIYGLYPYLDGAFAGIMFRKAEQGETETLAADGNIFFYNEGWLQQMWVTNENAVRHGCLHMLLHCMFRHVLGPLSREPVEQEPYTLYDAACDLAVERIIADECRRNLKAGKLLDLKPDIVRREILTQADASKEEADRIREFLSFDDHHIWYKQDDEERRKLESKWLFIDRYAKNGSGGHGMAGNGGNMGSKAGGDTEKVGRPDKSRTDYRTFLRNFTVPGEAMELDPENFDYIYYTLGMERYGDIPLIEPLEYREGHRLRQLAIAIDTSGSCSAETVRRFLSETYAILAESENFFGRMEVLVMQCDAFVQEAVIIHSREEWEQYIADLTIKGRGGTDFRPVFSYIDKMQKNGKMKELKALIYFTDGDGVYPTSRPESVSDYETAFVSLDKNKKPGFMPRWVRRVILDENF